MSRHESVSCDSCLKGNFRGKRYKCLICYDYDLCAQCYEAGATTTRHTTDHPMQCILTRADFDIFYGGEAIGMEQPQAFTCPYCGKMGYTEASLQEHVTADHSDSTTEVVCPICAALPGGDPNHVTDEFAAHLTLEHRAPRDFDEPMGSIRHVRRIPHPSRGGAGGGGGGAPSSRTRRANMQFHTATGGATAGLAAGLAPGAGRDSMDPIAELLQQLSTVRNRAAAAQNVSSQLQQLEMQLQSTRQQLERLPRRSAAAAAAEAASRPLTGSSLAGGGGTGGPTAAMVVAAGLELPRGAAGTAGGPAGESQYLLARVGDVDLSDAERQQQEVDHADRSLYLQELLLSSLADKLRLPASPSDSSASDTDSDLSCSPAPPPPVDELTERSPSPLATGGATAAIVENGENCVVLKPVGGGGGPAKVKGGGPSGGSAVKH